MRQPQPSLIAEIPREERPRERLLRYGARTLSDGELVAVLLRNGRPGASVLEVARELLAETGGLTGLTTACSKSLRLRGVGEVKISTMLAAVEIACRMAAAAVPDREPLSKPAAVARHVHLRYGCFAQEVMGALYLCTRGHLVGERELYRGTLSRAVVEPRAVLREGLLLGAAAVILFHTHPSGDATPSREDVGFTERMVKAGDVVGITVVDHLVVAEAGGGCRSRSVRGDRVEGPGRSWSQSGCAQPAGSRAQGRGDPPRDPGGWSMTEAEAQAALAAIALELAAIEDRLQHIHDELPQSPQREAMWEHKVPRDVPTEIVGTIECVLVDQLRPMIEQLEAAARVTAGELRERFHDPGS